MRRFLQEVVGQWRSLSVEVRSVRSMLEEVLSNWERYGSTVASLQAWLEDAEAALSQPENTKRVGLHCCLFTCSPRVRHQGALALLMVNPYRLCHLVRGPSPS